MWPKFGNSISMRGVILKTQFDSYSIWPEKQSSQGVVLVQVQ